MPRNVTGPPMKLVYTYFTLTLVLLIAGCGPETTSYDELVERNGITYKVNSETGFTGKAVWLVNGQKKEELTYKDGKNHGLSTAWFENGRKKAEMTYKVGKRNGLFTVWFESGQKSTEGYFQDGRKDDLWTMWYENGQKSTEETYKGGELFGLSTKWSKNGHKESESTFKDGKLGGLKTVWFESGQKKIEETHASGQLIESKYWHESGQIESESSYSDGQGSFSRLTNSTSWDKKGQITEEVISKGDKIYTKVFKHYDDGQLKSESSYTAKHPQTLKEKVADIGLTLAMGPSASSPQRLREGRVREGLSRQWFANGQKQSEQNYTDGKLNGLSTFWFANGQKQSEQNYTDGKLNGLSTFWFENGTKKSERPYKNGELNGIGVYWNEYGEKVEEWLYKDGIAIEKLEKINAATSKATTLSKVCFSRLALLFS
ncbi:toxin-antitoxin system YwqK family antitoxin [bacterium]|nr:toxin-antitoxin system YwqK family antitoxin [bacterium]